MSGKAKELILMLDNPCEHLTEDGLGLDALAETIAGAAMGNKGPFTIGVFGEWGQGKTSLLRLSHDYIKGEETVVSTWFNAWQHEREKDPLFPLIAAITSAIEKKTKGNKNPRNFEPIKKIGGSLIAVCGGIKASGKASLPHFGEVSVDIDGGRITDGIKEVFAPNQKEVLSDELQYLNAFQELSHAAEEVAKIRGREPNPKFVVFIDDLDRCDPESAVRLLESIKLILWQPGFVFVLALDERIITTYLTKQYVEKHGLEKDKNWGDFYLQKIINLQLRVPRHTTRFEKYTQKQVETLIKNYNQDPIEPTAPELIALTAATGAIAVGAVQNPRAFVRLCNQFLVSCRLWTGTRDEEGNAKDLSKEVAMAMAIDITLNAMLGEDLTTNLAESSTLCEEVYKEIGFITIGKDTPGHIVKNSLLQDGTSVAVDHFNTSSILRIICQPRNQPLFMLLSEEGREWFTNHQLRAAVRDFLSEYMNDTEVSFPPLVAGAILQTLGLGPTDPILRGELSSCESLDLSSTSVSDEDLKSLEKLPTLKALDLQGTWVTDKGIKSLEKLTALKSLSLNGTRVTNEGIKSLEKLQAISALDLGFNEISDDVFKSLERLPSLTTLSLAGTKITEKGIKQLERFTSLKSLHLFHLPITSDGMRSLEKLSNLAILELSIRLIPEEEIKSLEKALPNCRIHTY
jgi:Leucine-rich repeat (LRR) protein